MGVYQHGVIREVIVGKGELLKDGKDIVLIAIGSSVYASMEAANVLGEKGIDAAVIDARFAKPMDFDLIRALVNRTKRVVTVEENALAGGFGSQVLGLVSDIPDIRVLRIGVPDSFIEHGTQKIIRAKYSLDTEGIVAKVESFFTELSERTASGERKV